MGAIIRRNWPDMNKLDLSSNKLSTLVGLKALCAVVPVLTHLSLMNNLIEVWLRAVRGSAPDFLALSWRAATPPEVLLASPTGTRAEHERVLAPVGSGRRAAGAARPPEPRHGQVRG